jgi:hypothetical protein
MVHLGQAAISSAAALSLSQSRRLWRSVAKLRTWADQSRRRWPLGHLELET